MFLFANHDPAKSVLQTELNSLSNHNIEFITSNFSGYGLYKENVFDYFGAGFHILAIFHK